MFFYKYLLNPVMRLLLRSPLHGITSHNIAVLHFTGRKSGRERNTPLSYTREGDLVRLLTSEDTRWWRNFRGEEASVEIELGRKRYEGVAVLLEEDSEELREGVRRFIKALPRDAKVYGLQLSEDGQLEESSLAAIAQRLVLVEIHLK